MRAYTGAMLRLPGRGRRRLPVAVSVPLALLVFVWAYAWLVAAIWWLVRAVALLIVAVLVISWRLLSSVAVFGWSVAVGFVHGTRERAAQRRLERVERPRVPREGPSAAQRAAQRLRGAIPGRTEAPPIDLNAWKAAEERRRAN